MENVMKCQICTLDYDLRKSAPIILSCGHTLCQTCLIIQLQKKKCPFCREQLLSATLSDYKKNFALMSIIGDRITPEISMVCSEDDSEAQYICLDCKSYVCDSCILHVHLKHNVKKTGDVLKEVQEKISRRSKVANLCEERQNFYEKTLKFMIQSIKYQVNTEFSRMIKALIDHQTRLLDNLNEIASNCNKYTLEKSEIEILKTKDEVIDRLINLDEDYFKEWDRKTNLFIQGNDFYQKFKEFAHIKFVCSDFLNFNQLESSIFVDMSEDCKLGGCGDYCGKLEQFSDINLKNSDRSISKDFSITDLEIFYSQFFSHKAKIDRYEKNCELENYYKDNIERIRKANTSSQTLKTIGNYFKEKSIATRKRDKKTAYSASVNQKNLEIKTSDENSYFLFILAYLSIPTVKKFILKNFPGRTDSTLLLAKQILRKMYSESSQTITCDDIKRLFIPFSGSISKKNEVMIFMLKSLANLQKKIQESRIKMNPKYQIPELFNLKCTLCSSAALEDIQILEKKIPNFTNVTFSSKTLRKNFVFYKELPCYTKDIKTEILQIDPAINLKSLVIIEDPYYSIAEDVIDQNCVYAVEVTAPINDSYTKIIPVYQGCSENEKSLSYFMRVSDRQDQESLIQELADLVKSPIESKYFHSISFDNEKKISSIRGNAYIRYDLGPVTPTFNFENKYFVFSLGIETLYTKCQSCTKNSLEIDNYPHTFMVHMKFAFFNKECKFSLGDRYSTRIPHKLIAVLVLSDSKDPSYSSYFIGADRKGYVMRANYCKEIKLSGRIIEEPIIMVYSIYD